MFIDTFYCPCKITPLGRASRKRESAAAHMFACLRTHLGHILKSSASAACQKFIAASGCPLLQLQGLFPPSHAPRSCSSRREKGVFLRRHLGFAAWGYYNTIKRPHMQHRSCCEERAIGLGEGQFRLVER